VDHLHPGPAEGGVVVELERLVGRAGLRVALGVAGGLEGGHRDLVGADVVGVRVAAALVVGQHHLGPLGPDDGDQPAGGLVQVGVGEGVGMAVGLAVGHARVAVAEPVVGGDVQDLQGLGQLLAAQLGHPLQHPGWSMAGLRISPASPPVQVTTTTRTPWSA
jgi:hypothetical protein